MFRKYLALLALVPAITLGYSACTGEGDTEDDEALLQDEAAIVPLNPALIGTFRNVKLQVGQLALLTLKSDGTYHRGTVVACITAPCPPVAEDGTYTLWYRWDDAFMSLYPDGSREVLKYQYLLRESTLRLHPMGTREWITLAKTEGAAWCAVDRDCALQNLPEGPCAADWYCATNTCHYSCLPPGDDM